VSKQSPIWVKLTFLVLATGLIWSGCLKTTETVYSDENVIVKFKDTVNFVNIHASHGYNEMTVCGEKYQEVRGWIPFYLTIPGKDSIFFVTGRDYDNGQAMVHVVNLKTKTEIHFPAFDSHIGSNIRNTNNTDIYENIEKVDGDEIVINAGQSNARYRYYLNLAKPEFEKEEAYWLNSTTSYVWLNGRRDQK